MTVPGYRGAESAYRPRPKSIDDSCKQLAQPGSGHGDSVARRLSYKVECPTQTDPTCEIFKVLSTGLLFTAAVAAPELVPWLAAGNAVGVKPVSLLFGC